MKTGPKKGYKQTEEHIAKRKRFGIEHPNWRGDNACQRTGRSRAERMYPNIGACVACGNPNSERHHLDDNTLNNEPNNIAILCRRCHMKKDGRIEEFRKLAISNLPKAIVGAALFHKSITRCPKGHPYSGDNLYINPRGARSCRKCLNDYKREKRRLASAGR